jgi:DNA polymerase-1
MRAVAIDLETRLFGAGNLAPLPIVMSITDESGNRLSKDWRGEALRILSQRDTLIVGHNVAYDLGCIYQHAPETRRLIWEAYDAGRVSDTGIRDRIILLAKGHRTFDEVLRARPTFSLAEAVKRNIKDVEPYRWWFESKDDPDSYRTRYSELENVDLSQWPEAATKYALADSLLTYRVWVSQNLESANYRENDYLVRNESDQVRAAWALHLISAWGLRTDYEKTQEFKKTWSGLIESTQSKLIETGLMRETHSSKGAVKRTKNTSAIRDLVSKSFLEKGLPVPLTDAGAVSTEREVLEDTGNPALLLLAEHTKIEKLLGTYMPVLESGIEYPIHTRYEVLLETGRTSSSNPNLQNIPRDSYVKDYAHGGEKIALTTREAFVPRPGNNFVSVDYDTLELRTLSQVCIWSLGHSELGRVLNEKLDPHLDLAAVMLGIPYEEAKRLKDTGDKKIKYYRNTAKAANFGYPGGLGAEAFGAFARTSTGGELRLSKKEAKDIKDYWASRWTEMRDYFRFVERFRVGQYYDIQMYGSSLIRANCTFTAACNTFFQGLAAHGAKRATYLAVRAAFNEPNSAFYGSRPVMFIHDEIVAEVPEDRLHEAGMELSRIMCEAMQDVVPDVKITASPAAMERWYKAADPVFENGRLKLWRPGH